MQLSFEELKASLINPDLTQLDCVLLLLAYMRTPSTLTALRTAAVEAGLKKATKWNLTAILSKSAGKAISLPQGWELTVKGRQHLAQKGIVSTSLITDTASILRQALIPIKDSDTRAFLEEAVACFENKLWRGAVVLSWVGAVSLLQQHIIQCRLADFNKEATNRNPKWKNAKNSDDLSLMKEGDFLDILAHISVLGKNVKERLKNECLALRNACGHPNSFKLGPHIVMAHLEVLLLNVYSKF